MPRDHEYESELTATRDEIAAVLNGVADGITAGSIRFGDGEDAVVIDAAEEITLEIEVETEDDDTSLELEMEWSSPKNEEPTVSTSEDPPQDEGEQPAPVGAANGSQMLARFEVFRDKRDEWRWRLRHRNGNVIATSGEGYTRKHNAQKGLRSVMRNAPDAEVTEDSEN